MVCVLGCAKRTSLFDVCVVGPVGPQFMFPVDEICVSNRFVCNLALSDMRSLSGVVLAPQLQFLSCIYQFLCLPYHVMGASECQKDRDSEGGQ